METKTFKIDIKQVEDEADFFVFEGLASTFGNVDRGNDRVIKGAFKQTIKDLKSRAVEVPNTSFKKLMPVLWQHNRDMPIGSFVEMRETSEGLFVKGILPKDDTFVSGRVMPQMNVASISDMSIGYIIEERSIDSDDVWNLEKLSLFETSLVTIPMNAEATITAFKCVSDCLPLADRNTSWDKKSASDRVGDNDGAYLFTDEAGEKKLLIADMVDGELKAVPEAIFEASTYLRMFGVDASDQRAKTIASYYKEMGLEDPFKKSYLLGEREADTLTPRQFEKFLFASKAFSKEGAKLIASKFKPVVRDADSKQSVRDATQKDGGAVVVTLEQIANLFTKESQNDRNKK